MTREEAKKYWTARYEAARNWDDPHWEASERKEHREYVEALLMAVEALSAEAVQVVRCKDCKHHHECCRGTIPLNPDGYCSDGSRKEQNNE